MWRICNSHHVHRWIFQFIQLDGYKCCQSHLERLLHHRKSDLKYQSIFTSSKPRILHPQYSKDKIQQDYSLIYQNRLMKIIGPARILATTAGIATAIISLGQILRVSENQNSFEVYALSGMCLFSIFMVGFVNVMFKYYLLRIYYNKDSNKFIGVYNSFFGSVRHVKYSFDDLKAIKRPATSEPIHIKCNVRIGGRSFHLRGSDFIVPKYYNMHMGL